MAGAGGAELRQGAADQRHAIAPRIARVRARRSDRVLIVFPPWLPGERSGAADRRARSVPRVCPRRGDGSRGPGVSTVRSHVALPLVARTAEITAWSRCPSSCVDRRLMSLPREDGCPLNFLDMRVGSVGGGTRPDTGGTRIRPMPRMKPDDVIEFLAQPHVGVLATLRRDGRPYTVPVWFLHHEGAFWITGTYDRVWCKQLFGDPRASLCIEAARRARPRGVDGTVTVSSSRTSTSGRSHACSSTSTCRSPGATRFSPTCAPSTACCSDSSARCSERSTSARVPRQARRPRVPGPPNRQLSVPTSACTGVWEVGKSALRHSGDLQHSGGSGGGGEGGDQGGQLGGVGHRAEWSIGSGGRSGRGSPPRRRRRRPPTAASSAGARRRRRSGAARPARSHVVAATVVELSGLGVGIALQPHGSPS